MVLEPVLLGPMVGESALLVDGPNHPSSSGSFSPSDRLPAAQFLSWRRRLMRQGGEEGALDWLLDVVAGVPPSRLPGFHLHPEALVELRCPRRDLESLWDRYLNDAVPLQYLAGRCFWRDFELEVKPGVLIPRPETELLVDIAEQLVRRGEPLGSSSLLWADLGTGSGCLALALAQAFPQSHGLAVEISPTAIDQARHNLGKAGLGHRVRVIQGDWLEAVKPWWGRLHLLVANPPYIPSDLVDRLDPLVRDHEPRLALDGGSDGLASIRQIAEAAPGALAPGGWLLVEHHHDQSERVLRLLASQGMVDGCSHADLEGHRRFVTARCSADRPSPIGLP